MMQSTAGARTNAATIATVMAISPRIAATSPVLAIQLIAILWEHPAALEIVQTGVKVMVVAQAPTTTTLPDLLQRLESYITRFVTPGPGLIWYLLTLSVFGRIRRRAMV